VTGIWRQLHNEELGIWLYGLYGGNEKNTIRVRNGKGRHCFKEAGKDLKDIKEWGVF
jgi:hypothetical protein